MDTVCFSRIETLVGTDNFSRLRKCKVLLFGVGGVGGWTAECLVRSGIEHLTIVDYDTIESSNINRQVVALQSTIGQLKVDVLRQRLLDINSDAEINAIPQRYCSQTVALFDFNTYDYIIDAIDDVPNKLLLIRNATASTTTFISSMGSARRLMATDVQIGLFSKTHGDPLARTLRQQLRPLPKDFMCVYSPSSPVVKAGSCMGVVATFGTLIASYVINSVVSNA